MGKRGISLLLVLSLLVGLLSSNAWAFNTPLVVDEEQDHSISMPETGDYSTNNATSIPEGAISYNGHCYMIYDEYQYNWEEAKAYCESLGGHLVTITTEEENTFLQNTFSSRNDNKRCYWIGMYRDLNSTNWKWVTDEDVTFFNWAGGEPNQLTTEGCRYVEMYEQRYNSTHTIGSWNDIGVNGDGTTNLSYWHLLQYTGFICEWDNIRSSIPDVWNFSNSTNYFGPDEDGYFITQEDYNCLVSNLNSVNKAAISWIPENYYMWYDWSHNDKKIKIKKTFNIDGREKKNQVSKWKGSCWGMSSWVCLAKSGKVSPSSIDPEKEKLKSINMSAHAESAINYYHRQFRLLPIQDAVEQFESLSQSEQLQQLDQMAEEANYGGPLLLISFVWGTKFVDNELDSDSVGSHAIVGYGVESGNWSIEINGTRQVYSKKIKIYDPSAAEDGDYNIYYNLNGDWCIKGNNRLGDRNIISSNNDADSLQNNGYFQIVTNDLSLIDTVHYKDGKYSGRNPDHSNTAMLLSNPKANYDLILNDVKYRMKGHHLLGGLDGNSIRIIFDPNTTLEEENVVSGKSALLPSSDSGYLISTDDESMDYALISDSSFTSISANAGGEIDFSNDGSVKIHTSEETVYTVDIASDDGYDQTPWNRMSISGNGANEVAISNTTNGITVTSNQMDDVVISASDGNTTEIIAVSPDQDEILIAPDGDELAAYEDKDGNGSFEYKLDSYDPTEARGKVNAASLTLDGQIGINYFLQLTDNLIDTGAIVRFTHNDITSDVPITSDHVTTLNGETMYKFTYAVAAKEMNDTILLQIIDDEGNVLPLVNSKDVDVSDGYQYSVAKYCDLVKTYGNDKIKNLTKVMMNYGGYTQDYFGYCTGEGNSDDLRADMDAVTMDTMMPFKAVQSENKVSGISYYATSLLLESETTIRHYFKLEDGAEIEDYTFTCGENTLTPVAKNGQYYVEVTNIAAKDLDTAYTVTVTKGDETYSITYYALSYGYSVLKNSNKETLLDMVKALYLYNQAANSYFGDN